MSTFISCIFNILLTFYKRCRAEPRAYKSLLNQLSSIMAVGGRLQLCFYFCLQNVNGLLKEYIHSQTYQACVCPSDTSFHIEHFMRRVCKRCHFDVVQSSRAVVEGK